MSEQAPDFLAITQSDIDELARLLEDQPYKYAVVALRWISAKIERQQELNREAERDIATILKELDDASGGRERRFGFFESMTPRGADEPLH